MSHYRRDDTPGATWFFTVATYRRQNTLCDEAVRKSLLEAIAATRKGRPFRVDAWVLLPDHLHCLWTLQAGDADFSIRWNLIKRRTSQALGGAYIRPEWMTVSKETHRELTFWQRRFWEHRIRDDRDFERHADYIHYNPVKHGLCFRPADWPFSSVHRFMREGMYPGDWAASSLEDPAVTGEPE